MVKLIAVISVIVVAFLLCLLVYSQPLTGRVQGVCVDVRTGQPIDGAEVDIDLDQSDSDDHNHYYGNEQASTIFDTLPPGWAQGSQSDTDLDIAGHESTKKTHWAVITDSKGRFFFHSITAGSYTVTASSSGHVNEGMPLEVTEGTNAPFTITMSSIGESLTFDTPGKYWDTDQNPSLALRGLLDKPTVRLTLSKLDLAGVLKSDPKLTLQDQQSDDGGGVKSVTVRTWVDPIRDADDEGSFYDQIKCGSPQNGRLMPGVYRLTAASIVDTSLSASITFVVTDLALVSKAYDDHLLLHAVDSRRGTSVRGLTAECLNLTGSSTVELSSGTTQADGTCTLSTTHSASESQGVVVVRRGDQIAAAEVNLNSPGSDDQDNGTPTYVAPNGRDLRAFIYTDRPVYRPGQTVQIKGISRWFQPGTGFTVPKGVKAQILITDGQNTTVDKQTVTTSQFGSWTMAFALSPETLTGEYTVQETIGDQTQSGTFAVAAYQKPDAQVSLAFDKQHYVRGDSIIATVTGSYFYGAPMSGSTGTVDIYRRSSTDDDNDDSGDGTAAYGDFVKEQNVVLDGNGQAKIVIDTSDQDPDEDQMIYTANAIISDGESANVTSQASVVVAQGDFSLTLTPSSTVADVGDALHVTAQAANFSGAPVIGKSLTVTAEYDSWQTNEDVYTTIASGAVTTGKDGTAVFPFRADKSGLIDVTFSGVDDRGNTVSSETQIWVPSKEFDIDAQYSDLSIVMDKTQYKPGETAKVLITTEHPGPDALVTIEGTTLYQKMVVRLTRRATEVDVPVKEEYAPGVTVAVNCIVDKQYLSSSAQIDIEDPRRALTITVQPDRETYHPDGTATLNVHTADYLGRPVSADLSLAVVDESIFSIMPEPAGTIQDAFLPQQTDDVTTSNSTETVYYGDVDKGSTNVDVRKKFPDTALWKPDVITDRRGNAAVSVTLPDTLTTWRVTAYGQTADTMVGKGVGKMVVNKDLSVHLDTPFFLVQGDQSTLIATVHNSTSQPLTTELRLFPGGLQVEGSLSQQIVVQPDAPSVISWTIRAPVTGTFQPQAIVQSGSLNDGIQATVIGEPHAEAKDIWNAGVVTSDQLLSINTDPHFEKSSTSLTVRLTPTLSSALPPAAEYLSSYPFGSTDSTAGALIADATLYGAKGTLNLSAGVRADLLQKAQRSLLRLYREQQGDGGWGWFSTDRSECWMTAYATYAITLARQSGISINQSILNSAVTATGQLSDQMQTGHPFYVFDGSEIALSALVLSENGSPMHAYSDLQFLVKHWTEEPDTADNTDMAIAALTAQMIGTPESIGIARKLMQQLWSVGRETGAMISWTYEYHSSAAMAGEYLPDDGATAWALLAAQAITPNDPRIDEAAQWLAANRNDDHWNDIDDTGVVVLAMANYLSSAKELAPDLDGNVLLNGKPVAKIHFDTNSIGDPDTVINIPASKLNPGVNLLKIERTGTGRLYYSVKLSEGIRIASPQPPPSFFDAAFDRLLNSPKPLTPTPSGYRIKRIYMRLTSRRNFLWEDTVPARDWQFQKNDSILVRLIVDSTRPGSRIVIDEPVPAGCRIGETSGEFDENWDYWWDYTDVRDKDIVFFVDDLTKGEHEIDYHLVAVRPGDYDVMPTAISSMVDPTLHALGSANKVIFNGN